MRLIQATVPPDALSSVEQTLDEREIAYFATRESSTDEYDSLLYISIPEEEVESILEDLYDAGLGSDDHVVIIDTEVDIFGEAEESAGPEGHARIASAELKGKTEDLLPDFRTFITMMMLSTIVATTGVLLDSPAVVVGSMVLAPLFGPAVSTSVGTVIDEQKLFWKGLQYQTIGVGLGIASAIVFAWILKNAYLIPVGFAITSAPQIVNRLSPDLLSLVVALVAGMAGVISIATAAGRALVGVMMAAALLPPAAIVGIGIAWGEPNIAIHSGILLAVNLLAINFAGLATLWYLGYRPQSWIQIPQTRRTILIRGGTLLVAILVTSAFLWNVTYVHAQQAQLEETLEQDLQTLLQEEKYANYTLVGVRVVQDRTALTPETDRVVVTIGRPPDESHPELHWAIDDKIDEQVGRDVTVDVQVSLLVRADEGPDEPVSDERFGHPQPPIPPDRHTGQ